MRPPLGLSCILRAFLILATAAPVARSQSSGHVGGKLTDASDRSPLWGATVYIGGTTIGTVSDAEGRYRLSSIKPGRVTVHFRYLGYRPDSAEVEVISEKTQKVDVAMHPDEIVGQEVVVTAQLQGQNAAINQQLTSNKIVNVVSKDRIRELPDNNAAESIGRLPGVSIERDAGEGSKVIVRGLAPKFNSITINGQKIPATDPENRSVDLSMISSDILAGMEVVKAITPDQDGDAVGGTVNFSVKKAETGLATDVRVLGGYNHLNDDFGNYRGSITFSDRLVDDKLGMIFSGNVQRANRGSDNLSADYGVVGTLPSGDPDIRFSSLSLVDKVETRYRYGANFVADYALPNGNLVLNSLYSRTERDEVRRRKGYSLGSSPLVRYVLRNSDINTDLFTNSLTGIHDFQSFNLKWQAAALFSRQNTASAHESEFREIAPYVDQSAIKTIDDAIAQAKNDTSNTTFYNDTYGSELNTDRDLNGQIDITVPFALGDQFTGDIKFGGKYRDKSRSLNGEYRYIEGKDFEPIMRADSGKTYIPGSILYFYPNISNFYDPSFDFGNFLDGRYVIGPAGPLSVEKLGQFLERHKGVYKPDYETDQKDYSAGEQVAAAYLMTQIQLGPQLMILPGVRYERTASHYSSKHSSSVIYDENGDEIAAPGVDTLGSRTEHDVLPMVHVRYRFTEWFDVRLAFTRTLSRPNFLDLVPWERETSDGLERGEPNLKNTRVWNYDLFLSFYDQLGLLTVGGFYKNLEGLDYIRKSRAQSIRGAGAVDYYHPENSLFETNVYGIEFDLQSNLRMLPSPFDGIVFNVNFALIRSQTYFPYQIVRSYKKPPNPQTFIEYIDSTRESRMPGQANQLGNVTLGYEKKAVSARISLSYQGDALQFVGAKPELDGYSKAFLRWDIALQYKVFSGFALLVNVTNLTSLPEGSYLGTAASPTREEYYGWTADFGFKYEL